MKAALTFVKIFFALIFIVIITLSIVFVVNPITKDTIVSTTEINGIITNVDYAMYATKAFGEQKKYIISIQSGEFFKVFEVNEENYAKYSVGDEVSIEKIEKINSKNQISFEYILK